VWQFIVTAMMRNIGTLLAAPLIISRFGQVVGFRDLTVCRDRRTVSSRSFVATNRRKPANKNRGLHRGPRLQIVPRSLRPKKACGVNMLISTRSKQACHPIKCSY